MTQPRFKHTVDGEKVETGTNERIGKFYCINCGEVPADEVLMFSPNDGEYRPYLSFQK